ncbi:hypothetical protein [Mesorhizobium sp. B2-1-3A]|uniref:hypothetical protein n=1 Tax=Mesorhizobium sp. B2-1-3A TaxID=2589971 RepID=UPI001125DA4C|nr:hypothetical protein [Mesorhizobium sp. B2-1-3A]TPM95040.1 hypothetical protein FJ977_23660 [Mesorhizobium sp. B2-1-3A]
MIPQTKQPQLDDLVEHYIEVKKKRSSVVSARQAEKAIRTVMPDCPLDGKAFDTLVAAKALAHGLAVAFEAPAA